VCERKMCVCVCERERGIERELLAMAIKQGARDWGKEKEKKEDERKKRASYSLLPNQTQERGT
jgi:hypothetical protein